MFFFLREKRGRENLGSFHLVLFSFAQARLPLSLSQFPLPSLAMSCRSPHRALGLFGGGVDSCGAVFVLGEGWGEKKRCLMSEKRTI